MKARVGVAAILLVIAVALYFFFNAPTPPPPAVAHSPRNALSSGAVISPSSAPVKSTGSASNVSESIPPQVEMGPASLALAAKAGQRVPDSGPAVELAPDVVLRNIRRAVHQYGEMFDGNPVGTNPEITRQLSGDNPRHLNFLNPQPGARIDASGELVDAWGTPYFFHQISGSEMEIHSAGPDKIMWTSDDLVVK